jgi:glycosyltransferase involved in cell wall biosynthesis
MLDHTFVILAYKESDFLRPCIASLRSQSAPSRIILSTSTPSPFLEQVCAEYDLHLCVNEEKGGIAADWNFAYSQARTKYVTLAHQDDVYEPTYAERMVTCADERPDTLFAFSDYYELIAGVRKDSTPNLRIKRILRTTSYLHQHHVASSLRKKLLLAFGCPIPCPSVMFNASRLSDFRFSTEYSINMDWDAWYRLSTLDGSIACVPSKLLGHRLHSESETTAGISDRRRPNEDKRMFARMWPAPIAGLLGAVYELGYRGNSEH